MKIPFTENSQEKIKTKNLGAPTTLNLEKVYSIFF